MENVVSYLSQTDAPTVVHEEDVHKLEHYLEDDTLVLD